MKEYLLGLLENLHQNKRYNKNKDIFVKVIDLQDEFQQQIYLDQTGKFPTTSSKGNQYIMILAERIATQSWSNQ